MGDKVYVKLRPYRQRTLARRMNEKLSARFYGPFEIEARVGTVAYKLKLPEAARIHPTFHISQLKKAVGESTEVCPLPPQLNSEGGLIVEPELVLDSRVKSRSGQEELRVKWKGLSSHDSSWEWKSVITKRFPDFDLEDKVNFVGEGSDTFEALRPPILYQYHRRGKAQK